MQVKSGKRAVVLLSGGLDSATTAAIARGEGFELYALTFDYGQRHRFELEAAVRVAAALGIHEHRTVKIDLSQFGWQRADDRGGGSQGSQRRGDAARNPDYVCAG